jgi:hypothetical protein
MLQIRSNPPIIQNIQGCRKYPRIFSIELNKSQDVSLDKKKIQGFIPGCTKYPRIFPWRKKQS